MNKSIYLQIFILALVVALMGSFDIYGQNKKQTDIQFEKQKRNSNDNPLLAVPLPVVADFENGVFPPTGWSQTGVIWFNYDLISGYGIGTWSAVADFYSVGAGFDDLVTLEYISTGAAAPMLTFDWAYAIYPGATDHLEIYTSTNAGVNWTLLADMYHGAAGANNLNPFNLSQTAAYFPADDQWSTRSIALPSNTTNVKFSAVTDYGNLLWLDNIKITAETFFDNMEAYTVGGQLACQATPVWTTWSLTPCSLVEDPYISSNYAYSGTKSVVLAQSNDLVKELGGKTSGKWYVNFRFYIPAGKSGYVNLLSDFDIIPPLATYQWGLDCYFNADGTGELELDLLGSYFFNYQQGNWNNVLFVVDLDTDIAEFWVGPGVMTQIATWDWTQAGAVLSVLDAVDFYGAAPTDEMYFDNFYFSDIAPPIPQLSNDAGIVSIDMQYQYGPGTVTPMATVKNYGIATNSFNVQATITPGGYTSTKTVTALAPGAEAQVTFDNWTGTTGAYTINVCTQLTTPPDEDPLNDCQDQTLYIWDSNGDWTAGLNYPITTYNGIGLSYNDGTTDWLFVMGGNTTSTLGTECYKYNVTANTWTQIASLPVKTVIPSGAVVGNFIYVIGGSDGVPAPNTAYYNTVRRYDIAGDTWSTVASLPITIGWGRAVAYNNYIYVAGGIDDPGATGNYLATVYLYNVTTNSWSTASPMPLAVFGGGFALTGNSLVYAAGAYEAGILNTVMVGTITGNPAVINWAVMDNTYPGISNQDCSKYGADYTQEILTQTIGGINPLTDAIPFPGGALYRTHAHTWGSDAIIMAGGTPTSSYPQTGPSPSYIYKPATDTWVAQENVPAVIGGHQSGTFGNGSTWKYIVASGFGTTVAISNTQIYTQTLGSSTFALSVSVGNGWNMVSAPGLHPTNQNVGTWWPNLVGSVYRYQGGYQSVTTTTPGLGYWMKNNGAQVYNYSAITIVPHAPITGASGWNMIGGYELSVTAANVTTVPSGLQSGPIYKYSAGYQTATTIDPGYGYWIKLTGAGQIIIPETFAKTEAPVEYFPENWGKIVLTDATGINYTLYAVKGEVNLDQYELPPAPMAEMFDIRFSSGRIAEDINSSMKTIDMSGVTYPVTVRAEGMDMRLMDETGKTVNVNLKSGENVVISDATIQKLMVTGELIPAVYALEQNYPNPFNPSTVIEFSLPEDVSNVKLSIYNALGEKVAELVNTNLVAGKYQYQWNAKNVATGMYIYELRTDKFVSVKKMLLLK